MQFNFNLIGVVCYCTLPDMGTQWPLSLPSPSRQAGHVYTVQHRTHHTCEEPPYRGLWIIVERYYPAYSLKEYAGPHYNFKSIISQSLTRYSPHLLWAVLGGYKISITVESTRGSVVSFLFRGSVKKNTAAITLVLTRGFNSHLSSSMAGIKLIK